MFRFIWRRLYAKRSRIRIMRNYHHRCTVLLTYTCNSYFKLLFFNITHLTLPKRQQYINFYNIKHNKSRNLSSGLILKRAGYLVKFYKKNATNMASIVLYLKHNYGRWLTNVYLFKIKNFSYRQFLFFKKLTSLVSCSIFYLIHTKSYMPRFFPRRRIKRRIARFLGQS